MEDSLIEVLESLGYPVYRQGSMSADETYPDTFMTFWNNQSPSHSHYDNEEYGITWDYNIYVYSTNVSLTYSVLTAARAALKDAGWICQGHGFDATSDEETHTGRGMNILYLNV